MGGGIAVLVVDEDRDVLELTETFLESESDRIRVTTEANAPAAVEPVTAGEFDCVVSDMRMPEMNGLELFEAVRDERPELPFFIFSAADIDGVDERAAAVGVTGFIQKGAGTDHYGELAALIEDAVG